MLILAVALAAGASHAAPPPAPAVDKAQQVVLDAMASAGNIPSQARSLAALAWPAGKRDEAVAAAARHELQVFGDHALLALREALNSAKTAYTGEIVQTIITAQKNARAELAGDGLAALVDALWVGNREAKTLAIGALIRTSTPFAVQPMIDSALDDAALAPTVIDALGRMRYQQARFYLEAVMMQGPPDLRVKAASSLSQIGGAALVPLRKALKASDRETRLLAARAILPSATEYEVGAIYEYIEQHGDDDPSLTAALKTSAINIEKAIAARDANAAAASPKDF